MNKNRGIWIVIGSILVIGILVTFATFSFVNKESIPDSAGNPELDSPEFSNITEETNPDGDIPELYSSNLTAPIEGPVAEEKSPSGKTDSAEKESMVNAAENTERSAKSGAQMRGAEDPNQADQVPQTASSDYKADSVPETVISPKSPDTKNRNFNGEFTDGAAYYQKHLEDLDTQIKKMREESVDSNTYSMKALTDKELKLWNRELDMLYSDISDQLSEEAKKALEVSQQTWIKSRDAKAEDAAKKYSGGSLEELEYTASLAESARSRAYDLVAEYMDVLSSETGQ